MIPRSMPKRAVITEIECANFGKINGFSRLHGTNYALWLLVIVTVHWRIKHQSNILPHVPTFYVAPFWRYASYKFSLMMKKMMNGQPR